MFNIPVRCTDWAKRLSVLLVVVEKIPGLKLNCFPSFAVGFRYLSAGQVVPGGLAPNHLPYEVIP